MKWRWLLVVLLLALALPGLASAQGEYTFEILSTRDATCSNLVGGVTIQVFIDGEPAGAGVPVTVTWHGFDFHYRTRADGILGTAWGYTPGEGEVTVRFTAGGSSIEATFSGPAECEGFPVPTWSVVPSCDGREITFSAAWEGELDFLMFSLDGQSLEFEEPSSPVSHTFESQPGVTYSYLVEWQGESYGFTEGFVTAGECPPPAPELNRYHPWIIHSTLGHEGLDKVGVWGYFEGHSGDQFEWSEVTHEGGHVAWVGMPDGDYKALYRWCENGEVREYWDHFSFGGNVDIVSPTINLAEVDYTVVGPCGAPDDDP